MRYNPETHHRKNIRLKYYDYSNEGMYFITICTQNRKEILGKIIYNRNKLLTSVGAGLVPAQIKNTNFGNTVEKMYLEIEEKYQNIKLHDYIIMPNHLHGIIEICDVQFWAGIKPAPTVSIADVIRDFKSLTTLEYTKCVKNGIYKPFDKRIWQRNYYEHVIRNEKEYYKIVEYIRNNPLKWEEDKYFIEEGE